MTTNTSIEWTESTWNPIRGCSRVSHGCQNCYAMGIAYRFSGPGKPFDGLAKLRKGKPDWTGNVRLVPEMLSVPLKWRKPRRVFVNSMSDLFHPALSNEKIAAVFGVMAACPQHTFQVLTKRPERAREWFESAGIVELVDKFRHIALAGRIGEYFAPERREPIAGFDGYFVTSRGRVLSTSGSDACQLCIITGRQWSPEHAPQWPLPSVWLGTSVENQECADKRIPELLKCPAAIRFLSCEPLLGPVNIKPWLSRRETVKFEAFTPEAKAVYGDGAQIRELVHHGIDWVIVGSESGHGARKMDPTWARSIVDQSASSGAACFIKQIATSHGRRNGDRKGGDPRNWPEGEWPREFPQ